MAAVTGMVSRAVCVRWACALPYIVKLELGKCVFSHIPCISCIQMMPPALQINGWPACLGRLQSTSVCMAYKVV